MNTIDGETNNKYAKIRCSMYGFDNNRGNDWHIVYKVLYSVLIVTILYALINHLHILSLIQSRIEPEGQMESIKSNLERINIIDSETLLGKSLNLYIDNASYFELKYGFLEVINTSYSLIDIAENMAISIVESDGSEESFKSELRSKLKVDYITYKENEMIKVLLSNSELLDGEIPIKYTQKWLTSKLEMEGVIIFLLTVLDSIVIILFCRLQNPLIRHIITLSLKRKRGFAWVF